jgi:hypothetical protein
MDEAPSTKETAEFFKMMLLAGWVQRTAVVAWADSVLVNQAEPDPALIDISMSGSRPIHEVFSSLDEVRGSLRPVIPARMFMAYLSIEYEAGRKRSVEIVHVLHHRFIYDERRDTVLPQDVWRGILDWDILIETISYYADENLPDRWKYSPKSLSDLLAQRRQRVEDAKSQLDQKVREVLEWGRPYRDVLPVQCFPSGPDRTIDGHDC